jgi:hypothetical protein
LYNSPYTQPFYTACALEDKSGIIYYFNQMWSLNKFSFIVDSEEKNYISTDIFGG